MTAREVIEAAHREFVMVSRDGGHVELTAIFPGRSIPAGVIDDVRRHKPEILDWLDYEARADALLLESTRRIAAAWAAGCELDGAEWEYHEQTLRDAYWSQDLDRLSRALGARENHVLDTFAAYAGSRRQRND